MTHSDDLPESIRYCIIGAGIHGLSTAWHLAEELKASGKGDGSDIVVIEKTHAVAKAMEEVQELAQMAGENSALCSPSGAVRTLARMAAFARGESPTGRGDGLSLTQDELNWVVLQLRTAEPSQLGNIPGIDLRRADTLLAAAAIVQALMLRFSQSSVFAAPGGLREGLILEWAEAHKAG